MQQLTLLVVLAFWAAPLVPAASPASASFLESCATNQARVFLGSHANRPVQPDELAELKAENPDAYSLVKALLTKHSLGLLNPKKPTASFALPETLANNLRQGAIEASHEHHDSAAPQAATVALPSASVKPGKKTGLLSMESSAAVPYASLQPSHHDWVNWKPMDYDNDDQMMQNVLGSEAEPKGGVKTGLLSIESAEESPLPPPKAAVPHASVQPAKHDWMNWRRQEDDTQMLDNVLDEPKEGVNTGLLSMESPPTPPKEAAVPLASIQPAQNDKTNLRRQGDDQMVQNVVGAVAELKGDKKTDSMESPPPQPKVAPMAPAPQQNSNLRAKVGSPETPEKTKKSRAIDVPQVAAAAATAKRTSQVQATMHTKAKQPKLIAWMGETRATGPPATGRSTHTKEAPPPAKSLLSLPQAPAEAAEPMNPYLMDLS